MNRLDIDQSNILRGLEELDLSKQQARNDTLGHIDDSRYAVNVASNGFNATPRKMLIVQMCECRSDLLLVSPPSNDGRRMDSSQ